MADQTVPTSIAKSAAGKAFTADWFTLDGRRLYGQPTQKGVYINNGRKLVVK